MFAPSRAGIAGAVPARRVYFPFIGRNIGGSHVSAFTLGRALVAEFGIPCSVIARRDTPIAVEAAAAGFGIVAHDDEPATAGNGRHNPVYDLRRLPARVSLLRGLPKGILHFNDIGALQSWLLPAKLLGWPIVYHHRAINRKNLINRAIVTAADQVIAISDAARASVDYVDPRRLSTVTDPFAVDRTGNREAARAWAVGELGLAPDARIVGFVGNFWHRKRPDFFLDAAALLARRVERAVFVMFGRDGEITTAALAAQAERLGIRDRVHFPGFQLPVERNIAALDLLLMPAINEPFGRTPIEAALLGTPYVATDDAGHAEIGRRWQGGRLVQRDADPAAFAAVAAAVLDDPASVLLNAARRDAMANDVSPREHARAVVDLYERV